MKPLYPVIMVHGTGFRDDNPFYSYWGRIIPHLTNNQVTVFLGGQDSWGTIENNAQQIKNTILHIMKNTGHQKFHIIAHSKGGLDSRYMISKLQMADTIVSLTTISTPHHGSKVIDLVFKLPKFLIQFAAIFVNLFFRLIGDKNPDFYATLKQFTTYETFIFNTQCPNSDRILYQSHASKMKNAFSDLLFWFSFSIIRLLEGDNDGLVSVQSAQWGHFRGVLENHKNRGISHGDTVDLWRMNLSGFNMCEVYQEIIDDLALQGL